MTAKHIFCHEQMAHAEYHEFLGGEAVIYSTPSPDKSKDNNQDSCALVSFNEKSGLLVVADGVGGHRGGQNASAHAIEQMTTIGEHSNIDETNLREPILAAVEEANNDLLNEGLGAATTLVLAEIQGNMLRPYCIGDSTLLMTGQRGRIKYQSIMHSPTGYAVEAGVFTEQEAHKDPNRFTVANIVGAVDMYISVGNWIPIAARDTLLLCSDGLTDNMHTDEIVELIRAGSLSDTAEALQQKCRTLMVSDNGHADDLTFILYRIS